MQSLSQTKFGSARCQLELVRKTHTHTHALHMCALRCFECIMNANVWARNTHILAHRPDVTQKFAHTRHYVRKYRHRPTADKKTNVLYITSQSKLLQTGARSPKLHPINTQRPHRAHTLYIYGMERIELAITRRRKGLAFEHGCCLVHMHTHARAFHNSHAHSTARDTRALTTL